MAKQLIRITEAELKNMVREALNESMENGEIDEGFFDNVKGFFGGSQAQKDVQSVKNTANRAYQGIKKDAQSVKNTANSAYQGVKNVANKAVQGIKNTGNAIKQNVQNRKQDARNYSAAADIHKALQTLDNYVQLFQNNNGAKKGYNMARKGMDAIIQSLINSEINYK